MGFRPLDTNKIHPAAISPRVPGTGDIAHVAAELRINEVYLLAHLGILKDFRGNKGVVPRAENRGGDSNRLQKLF